MNFSEARELFQNGDIVFFSRGKRNIVRRLISWFTRSETYHVGIAFWMSPDDAPRRLMLAESQPDGYRIINLGFYQDRMMTVFRCPVEWGAIREAVVGMPGGIEYDFIDLAFIGMHERFGLPFPAWQTGAGEVCSTIVASILKDGGLAQLETMVSPARLQAQLVENNFHPYMVSHN